MTGKRGERRTGRRGGRRVPLSDELDLGTDKLYFKIGEVADILAVPAYVLRYWESEFKSIRPQKSRSRQRVYRRKDVEVLLRIKHLLYERKFTIAGARQELEDARAREAAGEEPLARAAPNPGYLARQSLAEVRSRIDVLWKCLRDEEQLDAADPGAAARERAILAAGAEDGELGEREAHS